MLHDVSKSAITASVRTRFIQINVDFRVTKRWISTVTKHVISINFDWLHIIHHVDSKIRIHLFISQKKSSASSIYGSKFLSSVPDGLFFFERWFSICSIKYASCDNETWISEKFADIDGHFFSETWYFMASYNEHTGNKFIYFSKDNNLR